MLVNFIIILLAIAGIFIFSFLVSSLMDLYFKHIEKQKKDIYEKYSFEREEIIEKNKNLQELEENYHRKIKILKDFCGKDTLVKYYDKYKIYNLAETLMQERDNLKDYTKCFENKLSEKEKKVLWEYIGNTCIDLKIKDYEDIKLRYEFYKDLEVDK